MVKCILSAIFILFITGCNRHTANETTTRKPGSNMPARLYSRAVGDSFSIFVQLPSGYDTLQKDNYPVVYLLDANLYFDIVATTLNKYAEVGLAPTVILVGIGYKDFPAMDSLRNRDDTYPVAIPEYEMATSGGADKFLSFIDNELVSYIDNAYKTDTLKRVLMGHSLAGYFTMYALQQQLSGKSTGFDSYIAASPSLHYNNYYLLKEFSALPAATAGNEKAKVYLTYGGLEDADADGDTTMLKLGELTGRLSALLAEKQPARLTYQSAVFSQLGHMDTQLLTFVKGLQWTLSEEVK